MTPWVTDDIIRMAVTSNQCVLQECDPRTNEMQSMIVPCGSNPAARPANFSIPDLPPLDQCYMNDDGGSF